MHVARLTSQPRILTQYWRQPFHTREPRRLARFGQCPLRRSTQRARLQNRLRVAASCKRKSLVSLCEITYDNFLLGGETEQASDGTECLLGRDQLQTSAKVEGSSNEHPTYAFVCDISEDSRHVLCPVASLATDQDLGSLGDSVLDVLISSVFAQYEQGQE
jgi:hypothetical protein